MSDEFDVLEATDQVVVHGYKEPSEWLVYLTVNHTPGVLRFGAPSLVNSSPAVLTWRIEHEFGVDVVLTEEEWQTIRNEWNERQEVYE
jgi:hypothetical protein